MEDLRVGQAEAKAHGAVVVGRREQVETAMLRDRDGEAGLVAAANRERAQRVPLEGERDRGDPVGPERLEVPRVDEPADRGGAVEPPLDLRGRPRRLAFSSPCSDTHSWSRGSSPVASRMCSH